MSKPKIFEQMESAGSFWITDENKESINYEDIYNKYTNNIPIFLHINDTTNDYIYQLIQCTYNNLYSLLFSVTTGDKTSYLAIEDTTGIFYQDLVMAMDEQVYTVTNKSGDTMIGSLLAKTNTTFTRQMRNITISTTEPTSSDGYTGDVWIQYEE